MASPHLTERAAPSLVSAAAIGLGSGRQVEPVAAHLDDPEGVHERPRVAAEGEREHLDGRHESELAAGLGVHLEYESTPIPFTPLRRPRGGPLARLEGPRVHARGLDEDRVRSHRGAVPRRRY